MELLKKCSKNVLTNGNALEEIWRTRKFLKELKNAIIHAFYKTTRQNWCVQSGVSHISNTYRILNKCLQGKIKNIVEQNLGEYQEVKGIHLLF